jgi:hypothetical protein
LGVAIRQAVALMLNKTTKEVTSGMWNDFVQGFIKGAKETPRGFFAPAVAIWRILLNTTESLIK